MKICAFFPRPIGTFARFAFVFFTFSGNRQGNDYQEGDRLGTADGECEDERLEHPSVSEGEGGGSVRQCLRRGR